LHQFKTSIDDYTKALAIKPYASIYYDRGVSWLKLGEFEQAIMDFTSAIDMNPSHSDAYNNRGFAYDAIRDYEKAIVDYSKAIEIKADAPNYYSNRGMSWKAKGDINNALKDFNKAIEINPKNYKYLYNKFKGMTTDEFFGFADLLDNIVVVIIFLDDDQDENSVFESITPPDAVRGLINAYERLSSVSDDYEVSERVRILGLLSIIGKSNPSFLDEVIRFVSGIATQKEGILTPQWMIPIKRASVECLEHIDTTESLKWLETLAKQRPYKRGVVGREARSALKRLQK